MQALHVIMRKEDVEPERVGGKVAVVFDVLFATTTVVSAFEAGVTDVVATQDPEAARAAADGLPADSFVLAGERHMKPIPGFLPSVPLQLTREAIAGKRLIYSTTNGTVALGLAAGADTVYAGALVNGAAVADSLRRRHHSEKVLLICSGDGGAFNIEDFVGAGYVVDCLMRAEPTRWSLTDAAIAARETYRGVADRTAQCLLASRLGRIMQALGQGAEVEHSARQGIFDCVPVLRDGRLVRV